MKIQIILQRKIYQAEREPISLDPEVLVHVPRRSFWEEGGEEWEHIGRRGNRKPSLDDYDRWPLDACFLIRDEIRRYHY